MVNTLKLKGIMVEHGYTQEQVARLLGLSPTAFNYKLNGKTEFKASEIKKLMEIFGVENVNESFFTRYVDLKSTKTKG